MKLLRYGPRGNEQPGLLHSDGTIRSLVGVVDDIGGQTLTRASLDAVRQRNSDELPIVDDPGRLGPCVAGVGKFLCIGLNYSDHATESGMEVPAEPV